MKEYIAEYIIPIFKKGRNYEPYFLEATQLIRCKDCYFCGTFQRKHYCTKYEHSVKQDGYCAWVEREEE